MSGHGFGARRLHGTHRRWAAVPLVAALAFAGALTAAPAGATPVFGSVGNTGICFGYPDAGGCAAGFGGSTSAVAGSTAFLGAAFTATDGAPEGDNIILEGSGTGIVFPDLDNDYQVNNSGSGFGCSVANVSVYNDGQSAFVPVPGDCAASAGQQLIVLVSNVTLPATPGQMSLNLETTTDFESVTTNSLDLTAPPTVPSAPKTPSASRGDGSVTVSWSAPDSNGGSALTGYHVYCSTGTPSTSDAPSATTDAVTTSATVGGLSTHTTYSCVVTAVNSVGQSVASDLVSAAPYGLPGAPTTFNTIRGSRRVELSWQRPTDVGGTPITGFTAYCSTSYPPPVDAAHKCGHFARHRLSGIVFGLDNGVGYYIGITATNAAGEGPLSAIANPTPAGAPSRPWVAHATVSHGSVLVRWRVPASDGGSPIVGYKTYCSTDDPPDLGSTTPVESVTNHVQVTGLTAGTTYYCVVVAVNNVAASKPSPVASVVAP